MKYIIDVPDNTQWIQWMNVSEKDGHAYFDYKAPEDLTPYTEPDRKVIEDEVWDFSMKTDFAWISEVGDKPLGDYSYQEAKAEYKAWLKRKDLRIGDEVILPDETRGIIMDREDDDCVVINKDSYTIVYHVSELRNTGRHYDCIINLAEVLKRYRDAV